MRKTNLFAATILAMAVAMPVAGFAQAPDAAAPAADASASAKPAKKPMHKMHAAKGKLAPTAAGDKAVEDLNDASLNAAKSGKPFAAPTTPEAAKKDAHMPMKKKAMHKRMAKKAEAPAAAAPAADAPAK
jgi:hypothetical protein